MMKDKKQLREEVLGLEEKLLDANVRQSAESLNQLLADDFSEFCSSGKVYQYQPGDVFTTGDYKESWKIKDFSIDILADNLILAKYKLLKGNDLEGQKKHSLRSSIWKLTDDNWKMLFHQGTLIPR